jgi:hypothetical protein
MPEDAILHRHRRENLKSYEELSIQMKESRYYCASLIRRTVKPVLIST